MAEVYLHVPVLPQQDLVNTLANTVATLFAGFGLTSLYLISFGTDYPPIDQDVTFWCVTPYVCESIFMCRTII